MAGVSLFLAMVYIVVVIPSILADTGLSKETLMANTILFCGVGTLVFAAATRLPFAVGPGIVPCALLATFLHTRGIPWPQVCGIGVIAGGVFSVLAWSGLLTRLAQGTPTKLKLAIKVAIGFYLMAIAAVSSGLAAPSSGFFKLSLSAPSILFLLGVGVALALAASRRFAAAAILGGILASTLGALILGVVTPPGHLVGLPPLQLAFSVHLREVFRLEYLDEILLVTYLLVADVVATLESIVAPASAVSLRQADGAPRRLGASLRASGLLAIAGPLCGAGPVVVFFESVSAVLAGGRTWRCSLWVGLFFGVLLFVIPLATVIPLCASAVALAYVGYAIAKYPFIALGRDRHTRYLLFLTAPAILLFGNIALALCLAFLAYPLSLALKPPPLEAETGLQERPTPALWGAALASLVLLVCLSLD